MNPKFAFPAVQLDVSPFSAAGLVALPLVPAGLDAEGVGVVSVLDGVVLVLSWVPVCICAVPAHGKTIAARIAIRNAIPVLVSLMV
ncbi:MAG: hypothetical protein WAL45_01140 [Terracidiphilus sp.]